MRSSFDRRYVIGAAAVGWAAAFATQLGAATLAMPAGKPILTVSGKIASPNQDGAAVFDRDMLERLGMVTIETSTPWYKDPVRFEGVPLAQIMKAVQASGQKIQAVALNDYSSEIPIEDVTRYNVILALKRDGEYMPVRDKGPLFIVYPYDSAPELKSQTYYGRSVWQISKLIVK